MQAATRWRQTIYEDREKYDRNNDGKIDVNEFIEYYKVRMAAFTAGKGERDKGNGGEKSSGYTGRGLDEEKPKVVVPEEKRITFRYSSLPKDLPSWFAE